MHSVVSGKKRVLVLAFVLVFALAFASGVEAKSFTIFNSSDGSMPYFSVNGSTGNVGIGTEDPETSLEIPNDGWISAEDSSGTGVTNMFKTNTDDQIEVGSTLNIGNFEFDADSGLVTFADMPVTSSPSQGTAQSYFFRLDGNNLLNVYGEADGSGGIQNAGVGVNMTNPQNTFNVDGDGNFTGNVTSQTDFCIEDGECLGNLDSSSDEFWNRSSGNLYPNDLSDNVGIGTDSPSGVLDVKSPGAGNSAIELTQSGSNNDLAYIFEGSNNQGIFRLMDSTESTNIELNADSSTDNFINNAGNFGIGTTSPSSNVEIQGTTNNNALTVNASGGTNWFNGFGHLVSKSYSNSGDYWAVSPRSSGNFDIAYGPLDSSSGADYVHQDDSVMSFTQSRQVGIGTSSPGAKLTVQGNSADIRLKNPSGNNAFAVEQSGSNDGGVLSVYDGSGNPQIRFEGRSGNTNYVNNGGNLGIGTSNPQQELHVEHDIRIGGQSQYGDLVMNNDTDDRTVHLRAQGNSFLDTGGNLGVGTQSPQATLDVDGNARFEGTWEDGGVEIDGGDLYAQTGYFYNISALNVSTLSVNGSQIPEMDDTFVLGNTTDRWKSLSVGTGDSSFAGNLGVGTSSPSAQLDVDGDIYSRSSFYQQAVGGGLRFNKDANDRGLWNVYEDSLGGTSNLKWSIRHNAGNDLYFDDTAGGNLGIGTSNPGLKLDVSGNSRTTGYMRADGSRGVETRRGMIGGYQDSSDGGSSWGANIWSIGDNWQGSGHGTGFSVSGGSSSQYGLTWLRQDHTDVDSYAGEGLHIYRGGGLAAAIGSSGAKFTNRVSVGGQLDMNGNLINNADWSDANDLDSSGNVAWSNANDLGTGGTINDFSAANDLNSGGSVNHGLGATLSDGNTANNNIDISGGNGNYITLQGTDGRTFDFGSGMGSLQQANAGVSIKPRNNPSGGQNIFTVESDGGTSRFGVQYGSGTWAANGFYIGDYDTSHARNNADHYLDADGRLNAFNVTSDNDVCINGGACLSSVGGGGSGSWNVSGSDMYPEDLNYNVGIGTNSPDSRLHVSDGGANLTTTLEATGTNGASYLDLRSSGGGNSDIRFFNDGDDKTSFFYDAGADETVLNSHTGIPLTFQVGGADRLEIDASGNVGIGTGVTGPSSTLEVDGNTRLNENYMIFQNNNGDEYQLGGGNTQDAGTSGVHLESVDTNPGSGNPLFVVESSGASERLRVEHDGALKTSNYLEVDGSGDSYISGDLGVGSSSTPGSTLDVSGSAEITQNLNVDNNADVTEDLSVGDVSWGGGSRLLNVDNNDKSVSVTEQGWDGRGGVNTLDVGGSVGFEAVSRDLQDGCAWSLSDSLPGNKFAFYINTSRDVGGVCEQFEIALPRHNRQMLTGADDRVYVFKKIDDSSGQVIIQPFDPQQGSIDGGQGVALSNENSRIMIQAAPTGRWEVIQYSEGGPGLGT